MSEMMHSDLSRGYLLHCNENLLLSLQSHPYLLYTRRRWHRVMLLLVPPFAASPFEP